MSLRLKQLMHRYLNKKESLFFKDIGLVEKGFTLLELAIALTIISVLSYTLVLGVQSGRDFDKYGEDRAYLNEVRTALLTFVQANGYLPCPDTDNDGAENRSAGVCDDKNGALPYLELGLPSKNTWGDPLYYAVNNQADNTTGSSPLPIDDNTESASFFGNSSAPIFGLNTPPIGVTKGSGNYSVCSEQSTSANCATSTCPSHMLECAALLTVVSFGKNGAQTWSKYAAGNVSSLDAAEKENADDDNYFWQAQGSNVSGQEFDDQLIWLTAYDIKYAMLRSGRGLK